MASSSPLKASLAVILLLAAVGGYYFYQKTRTADQPPAFNTTTVTRGNVRQVVTATGQLDPLINIDVGSQISGLVKQLYVDFNTPVTKGQKLAEIDPATYQQRLRQAEADLAATEASNRLQRLNTERTRELRDKQLVSQQDYDQALALLQQSEAQLLTRKAAVENAKVDLERCTITSPIDGIVIAKQTEEGKTVAASLNAPVLFTIANDLAKMQITAAVAEADVGSVETGQQVTFTVDAFPNRSFAGQVTQVRNSPKVVSNVVTYDTIINVDNKDLKLRPGMTANVSIVVASREHVLRVPNAALRVRLPETVAVKGQAPSAAPAPAAAAAGGGGERRAREGGGESSGGRRGGLLGPDATPEQRQQLRDVMAELGVTNFREATAEQREQVRKVLIERGIIAPPAAPGEPVITVRTIYRLPRGDKQAMPEAVSAKIGITDGSASEVVGGLNEGDTIITGLALTGDSAAPRPAANPFGGGGRRF
ncbi:MAG: efflux RND transporter periplasmic adaptor subunit [Opitutaceae bacterium]|nr:efflux RND transporter periplasmic adaptor subunit [Opitutaceae bacterium]